MFCFICYSILFLLLCVLGKGGSLATIPQLFGENSLSALSNKLVARGVESSNTVRRKRPLDLTGDDDVDEDADDILERKADSEDASSISLLMSNEEKMEKLYSITRNGIMTSANYPAVTYTYHDDDPTESPNKIFILYALPSGVQSASSELLDDGTMIKVSYDWPSTLTDTAVLFPGGNYQPKPMGFNQALKLMGYEKTSRMRGYQIIPLPEKASTLYDFKMKKGNEGCIYCEITLQIQSKVPTVKHETLKVT